MPRYKFEIVPQVALDSRYNDMVQLFTFRTNERTVINALFTHLEHKLAEEPEKRYIFWLFDFATRNQNATDYFKQRLRKLALNTTLSQCRGRIAVATTRNFSTLLSPNACVSGLSEVLPQFELRGFYDRDDGVAWLIAGYERLTLRAH